MGVVQNESNISLTGIFQTKMRDLINILEHFCLPKFRMYRSLPLMEVFWILQCSSVDFSN